MLDQKAPMTLADATEIISKYENLRLRLTAGDLTEEVLENYDLGKDAESFKRYLRGLAKQFFDKKADFEASAAALAALRELPEENVARQYFLSGRMSGYDPVMDSFPIPSIMDSQVRNTKMRLADIESRLDWALRSVREPEIYHTALDVLGVST